MVKLYSNEIAYCWVRVDLNALPPFNVFAAAEHNELGLSVKGRLCSFGTALPDLEACKKLITHCETNLRARYPEIEFEIIDSVMRVGHASVEKEKEKIRSNYRLLEVLIAKPMKKPSPIKPSKAKIVYIVRNHAPLKSDSPVSGVI